MRIEPGNYVSKEVRAVFETYMDIKHQKTLDFIFSLNEADADKFSSKLAGKLYEHITQNVSDIDFGSIPQSAGDITKIENYEALMDCINVIKNLLIQYKQKTDSIDTIIKAVDNIKLRKDKFQLGFKLDDEMLSILYSTMVLAVVSSVGFMISSCIEYIKQPGEDTFEIIVNKVGVAKTKDHLLFKNLEKFNKSCAKGDMDKAIDFTLKKGSKQFLGIDGVAVAGGIFIAVIVFNIIPIIRELIYFFFLTRVKISDYFEMQSDLLTMNVYTLNKRADEENNEDLREIARKQEKIAQTYKNISNKINIEHKTSQTKVENKIKSEDLTFRADEKSGEIEKSSSSLF